MSLLLFFNGGSDAVPSVVLNTPADGATTSDTTPTLEFTGTDPTGDDLRYNVQIDTTNGFGVNTYYFNASDSGPTDSASVFTNDANAFDGSTSTYAATSDMSNPNDLKGFGTNAPTSGSTITRVRSRLYAGTDVTPAAWSSYSTLTVPSGGWTWQKVNDLEARFYSDTDSFTNDFVDVAIYSSGSGLGGSQITAALASVEARIYRAEVEVTTAPLLDKTSNTDPGFAATDTTKINSLVDYFNQTSRNATLWNEVTGGSATMTYDSTGVTVTFPAATTATTIGEISSVNTYNLTGGTAELQVLAVPVSSTAANGELRLQIDINNYVRWTYEAGTLYAQQKVSGTITTRTSFAYNGTTHKYWRIRELSGTTYWDTSTDGDTWTNRASIANPITVTALRAYIVGSAYQVEVSPGTFKFNNLNVRTFPSGLAVDYTVQSALAAGTYYWRARAIDPSGSNAYGAWATTRSFTISSGGGSITATGLPSTAVIGVPTLTPGQVSISPTGITNTSSLGTPTLTPSYTITTMGIGSTATLGAPTVSPGEVSRSITGISSTASIGTPSVTPGAVTISATGINSTAVLGTPSLASSYALTTTGIASTASVGTPTLTPGEVNRTPGSITSTSTLGSPTLTPGSVSITPTSIGSTSTVGNPTLTSSYSFSTTGIPSTTTLGTPTLTPGAVTITPTGIGTTASYGVPTVVSQAPTQTIIPTGLGSTTSIGTVTVSPGSVTISTNGISPTATVGSPAVSPGEVNISATGIGSTATIGTVTLTAGSVAIAPTGLNSTASLGTPSVTPGSVSISPTGISSSASIGSPSLSGGAVTISVTGLGPTSTIGVPSLSSSISLTTTGISPTSSVGAPSVTPGAVTVQITGLGSTNSYGNPTLTITGGPQTIEPSGVSSTASLGTSALSPGSVTISVTSVPITTTIGSLTITQQTFYITTTELEVTANPDSELTVTAKQSTIEIRQIATELTVTSPVNPELTVVAEDVDPLTVQQTEDNLVITT